MVSTAAEVFSLSLAARSFLARTARPAPRASNRWSRLRISGGLELEWFHGRLVPRRKWDTKALVEPHSPRGIRTRKAREPVADGALGPAHLRAEVLLRKVGSKHRKAKKSRALREVRAAPVDVDELSHGSRAKCHLLPTLSTLKDEHAGEGTDTGADVARARERSTRYADIVLLVGQRLKLRRMEAGYSMRRLKELSGIDINTISKIERGEQNQLSAGNFFALCEALALDPLLAWYGESRKPQANRRSEPPPPMSSRRPSVPSGAGTDEPTIPPPPPVPGTHRKR